MADLNEKEVVEVVEPAQYVPQESNYSIHQSWGGTQNFAHSYGLRLSDQDDVEEMHAITDAFKNSEPEEEKPEE